MINIKGLDKAEILMSLYNNSRPQGMGFLHATPEDMTIEEAREILKLQQDFDYLHGRVMKIDLTSDEEFDPWLYDRDIGDGAAEEIINKLKLK